MSAEIKRYYEPSPASILFLHFDASSYWRGTLVTAARASSCIRCWWNERFLSVETASTFIPLQQDGRCSGRGLSPTSNHTISTKCNFILSLSSRSISLREPSIVDSGISQTNPAPLGSPDFLAATKYGSNTKLIIGMDAASFRLQSKHGLDDG